MISEEQRYKNSAINGFFVETADHNYLVCRWCFLHGLYQDFYWNAMHAIEKYLKAALVLNDRSARGYQHDIVGLLQEVRSFATEFLPHLLICPNLLNRKIWHTEPMENFVERVGDFGNPNGRYGLISTYQMEDDLLKVDAVVFTLRRLAVRLDEPWVDLHPSCGDVLTNRDKLKNNPDWQPRGDIQKPRPGERVRQDEIENALLCHNFAFTDEPQRLSGRSAGTSARNSWLYLLAGDAGEEQRQSSDAVRANVIGWLVEHISFPRTLITELATAERLLRQRAGPPR